MVGFDQSSEPKIRRDRFVEATAGFTSALVLLSFLNQPLMRLAHPVALSLGGLMLAVGVAVIYLNYVYFGVKSPWFLSGLGLILGSAFTIGICWSQAIQVSRHTDKICRDLEMKMISETDDEHSPAVFQALACRPSMGSKINIK